MIVSFVFLGISNVSAETIDLTDLPKEVKENEGKFREDWTENGFDEDVQDIFIEKISDGKLPDSANPQVKPIKEETKRVNNVEQTKYYYEDGTYEIVQVGPSIASDVAANEVGVTPFMQHRLMSYLVQRSNGIIDQSYGVQYYLSISGRGKGERIVDAMLPRAIVTGGTLAGSSRLNIERRNATSVHPARANMYSRVNLFNNLGSQEYNLTFLVHGAGTSVLAR